MSIEAVRADDGSVLHWVRVDPDGSAWRLSPQGSYEAVWDYATGAWSDGLGLAPEPPEPQPVFYLQPQVDDAQARRLFEEGVAHEETRLGGRKLTHEELVPVLTRYRQELDAGRVPEVHDVIRACERDGEVRILNLDKREDRVEYQLRRPADEEAEANGWPLGEPPPPRQDGYDDMRREDRIAKAVDLMEGRVDIETSRAMTGSGYRPSDLEYENGEWRHGQVAG